jgi:hypothetical protein
MNGEQHDEASPVEHSSRKSFELPLDTVVEPNLAGNSASSRNVTGIRTKMKTLREYRNHQKITQQMQQRRRGDSSSGT